MSYSSDQGQPGQPQYGQPPYGEQQYGAPQYGAPQYGAAQYGAPNPPGQNPGNPYGQYGGNVPQQRGTNTLSIIALVLTFVFSPAGLICGIIARGQIKRSGEEGSGLALASIIVSSIFLALSVVYIIFVLVLVVGVAHGGSSVSNFSPSPLPTY